MTESLQKPARLEFTLDLGVERRDRRTPDGASESVCERIPRITKLLALAIKLERMLKQGEVQNRAALARAGQVSRARLTQIMNLLDLAPAIQEHLLYMKCAAQAPDPIRERQLRSVTKLVGWDEQQRRYEELRIENCRKRGIGKEG